MAPAGAGDHVLTTGGEMENQMEEEMIETKWVLERDRNLGGVGMSGSCGL